MIVGKYAFVFCGANDVGTGWFAVGQDGSVIGADIGNVTYNGTAREGDDGWITLDLELTIPAGTTTCSRDGRTKCAAQLQSSRLLAAPLWRWSPAANSSRSRRCHDHGEAGVG